MGNSRWYRSLAIVVALVLTVAGCGGDDASGDSSDSTAPVSDTAGAATTIASSTDTESPSEDDGGETAEEDGTGGEGDLSLVPEGETDILGNPAGQGFVEIDGTRYDFVLNQACQKIFGAVQAAGSTPADSDVDVDAVIPPEDWETDTAAGWDPPYVSIDIGDDTWRAEAGIEHFVGGESVVLTEEQSAVTSFTNNGSRVTGTANFFSAFNFDEVETVAGSFEFFCP